jgi:3-oxoacyl-[acyl-carrier-protein] synthase II
MQKAIKDSGIEISEIDYINAHGTSTTLNDLYETLAIEKVLGVNAKNVAVSSSKSMIGHTIGAAGAIEAAITAKSIFHGLAHPTINLNKPDPHLQLDYIPNVKRSIAIRCALSNSFAFGGHNSTLVFRKY